MNATADIPTVEDEIDGITSPIHRHWRTTSLRAVAEFIDEIEADERRGQKSSAAALLLLLLLLLRRRTGEPLPATTRARITRSASRLLAFGASRVGIGGAALGGTFTTGGRLGLFELEFMSRARLDGTFMGRRLIDAVNRYVENRDRIAPIPPALPDVTLVVPPADRPGRVIPAQIPPAPTPQPPADAAAAPKLPLIELQSDLDRVVSDPNAALSRTIVDAWAYRQTNIGIFEAAKAAGVRVLVARNPMDERTTTFCRWVNGKVIRMERVERQLRDFRAAVTAQDREAMIRAWRFIPLSKKGMKAAREELAQDRAPGARITDAEVFRNFFVSVGLPPYHWRCRTVVEAR